MQFLVQKIMVYVGDDYENCQKKKCKRMQRKWLQNLTTCYRSTGVRNTDPPTMDENTIS
jgi:hypothetical protein